MIVEKTHKNAEKFICEECNFKCSKQSDYNRHLSTRKHKMVVNGSNVQKVAKKYECVCGKVYKHDSGYYRHKKKCNLQQEKTPKVDNTQKEDERDKLINILFEEKKEMLEERKEMKELIILMVKSMQDVIPHVGKGSGDVNGDNNHNHNNSHNTLNFYLTNTCKDAETITEFTARFCERIETFFNGNYQKIANNQTDLAKDVQELFFECLEDKPQVHKFIQTTDTKNGVYYVKEPEKVEKQLTFGDSEFVKYKDGFEKAGSKLGHAINKTLQPCKNQFIKELDATVQEPKEADYENDEDYEKADDRYRKSTGVIKENIMFQTYNAMNIFDNKKVTDKVLTETKRPKQMC